ncbi:MAG: hypothetical protein EAZ92_16280 [Candidatus Kapaibacterium sp.]|nr:MAG: hypothetical protein EAZ92_16280 [Candidatus Kapabacteria bacterium]
MFFPTKTLAVLAEGTEKKRYLSCVCVVPIRLLAAVSFLWNSIGVQFLSKKENVLACYKGKTEEAKKGYTYIIFFVILRYNTFFLVFLR